MLCSNFSLDDQNTAICRATCGGANGPQVRPCHGCAWRRCHLGLWPSSCQRNCIVKVSISGFLSMDKGPPRNNLKVMCTRDKVVHPGAITTIRRPLLVPDHAARRYGSWALVVVIEKMSIVNMEPVRICEVPMQQRLPFPPCWNNETSLARVSLKA